jgi:hypothetical protein
MVVEALLNILSYSDVASDLKLAIRGVTAGLANRPDAISHRRRRRYRRRRR